MPISAPLTKIQELLDGLSVKTDNARSRWIEFFNANTTAETIGSVLTPMVFDASLDAFLITLCDTTLLDEADELMTLMRVLAPDVKFFIKILLEKGSINETIARLVYTHREHISDLFLNEFDSPSIDYLLSDLQHIKRLWLIRCDLEASAPFWITLKVLPYLRELNVHSCFGLFEAPDLKEMDRLEHLMFFDCGFEIPPDLEGCTSLKSLKFERCPLTHPPVFVSLSLQTLSIHHSRLAKAPDIKHCSSLREVSLVANFIQSPPEVEGLSSLETLNLSSTDIEYLPDLWHCPNLISLKIDECFQLEPQRVIALIQRMYQETPCLLTRIFNDFSRHDSHFYAIDFSGLSPKPDQLRPLTPGRPQAVYNEALQLSIIYNLPALAEQALNVGADIENQFVPGSTPLLEACLFARPEITLMLLERGARVKCTKRFTAATPLSIARHGGSGMAACAAAIEVRDAGFTQELDAIKKLAHEFSIDGISHLEGAEIPREGVGHRFFLQQFPIKSTPIYKTLIHEAAEGYGLIMERFSDSAKASLEHVLQIPSKRQALVTALYKFLDAMENPVNLAVSAEALPSEIEAHLSAGRPAVCFDFTKADTSWHIWGLVIDKQPDTNMYFVYRCNRGYGHFGMSGALGNLFSHAEMLEIVRSYQQHTDWKYASYKRSSRFFNVIHQKMSTNRLPYEHLPQKEQSIGNCGYYSLQAVEFTVLRLVLAGLTSDAASDIALAKAIKHVKTDKVRLRDLQEYLCRPGSQETAYPKDSELLMRIAEKARGKSKLSPGVDAIEQYLAPK